MVTSLKKNLNASLRCKLIQFPVNFLEAQNVVVIVFFGPVESAEFAVNIANIGVVDVAVHNVGDDVIALAGVGAGFGDFAPAVGQSSHFLKGEFVEAPGIGWRNALSVKDSINERVRVGRYHAMNIIPCWPEVNGSTWRGVNPDVIQSG
jgi:hypothetical protein